MIKLMQKLNWSASESTLSTSPVATNVENINTLRNLKKTFKTAKNLFSVFFFVCMPTRTHACTLEQMFFSVVVVQSPSHVWLIGNPMDCSTPGFPVLHHLLELAHPTIFSSVIPFSSCLQSCPVSRPFLMSKLFTAGSQVLEFQLQRQSFQWIFWIDFL